MKNVFQERHLRKRMVNYFLDSGGLEHHDEANGTSPSSVRRVKNLARAGGRVGRIEVMDCHGSDYVGSMLKRLKLCMLERLETKVLT